MNRKNGSTLEFKDLCYKEQLMRNCLDIMIVANLQTITSLTFFINVYFFDYSNLDHYFLCWTSKYDWFWLKTIFDALIHAVGAEVKNITIAFCKMFDMFRKSMHKLAIQICNINHIRFYLKKIRICKLTKNT